jgi:tetratricopeptide (TPR) repeat protein
MFNRLIASPFTGLNRRATLLIGALLLGASLSVHADDIQDAHKLYKQGQYEKALEKTNAFLNKNTKEFLANNPMVARARFLKGLILNAMGNTSEAISTLTSLSEDNPELPEPYNNLAVIYAAQGDYDKARQALEMAVRIHPDYATAHENLGDLYAKMAAESYEAAVKLDGSEPEAKTKLTLIQNLLNNKSAPIPVKPEQSTQKKP